MRPDHASASPSHRPGAEPDVPTIQALSRVGHSWALSLLVEAACHPQEAVRVEALGALERWWERFGQGQAPASLLRQVARHLRDPSEAVQMAAAGAVAAMGGDDGMRLLAERFRDATDALKGEILSALARGGYNAVAARLFRAGAAEPRQWYAAQVARRWKLDGPGG